MTDLNLAKARSFSPSETPGYKIADAVRASMSYPYYFQPFICPETGHYLSDGGIISNYPLFILPREEHSSTLSILIRTLIKQESTFEESAIEDIIGRPIQIVLTERTNIETRFYDTLCIQIQLGELNILEFSFDNETKDFIIKKGKDAITEYFRNCPKPKRRNSI